MTHIRIKYHHSVYFIRNEREFREVHIAEDTYFGRYYRVNGGKMHFDDVTKYISDITKRKGWRKTDLRGYLRNKYRKVVVV